MTSAPPPASSVEANRLGISALQAGDAAAAAQHFAAAISGDPHSGALQRNLASAWRALGDDARELAALDAALAVDRRDLMAWIRKAERHEARNDKGAALAAWSAAIALGAQHNPVPPPLEALLAHGQAFVAAATDTMFTAASGAFAAVRGDLSETEARRGEVFIASALGRRRIYQNECAGIYYPFLPADEFFDRGHFQWFAEIEAQTGAIRAELQALLDDPGEALRPYVKMDAGTPESIWSGLDNRLDWGACFLWEYGEPNQVVLDRCPVTAAALAAIPGARIPGRAPSAFFSMLKPHTRIPPHTGVTNTRAIVHLPLIVPPGCGFRVGGETRAWEEGVAFAFDDTIEHEAWNDSDELRAVLIFDVWNPHLSERERDLLQRYFASADASGYAVPR
ncbi:aspartyl/asparaginyl beta-hydroxylase (cupin superfamily) [Sphingopyxis sp. OAS728]|uniref:aspartyl/asparaginyl beta-hydroxylase domain-containing protein n=1 Tax=Sphingopyxis sp. OAS728 TaxID=2663823 RepID=UPI0019E3300B|nr:aspartyl/asparaginyl beta-hydroxylase domain-containing protein [Sphingopyxis sp. OAS728]MBE1527707.1 aspartyl/asparaginyl beta-hydroxylase (cupin superfamily) [Sphingopyxis sp. OAS728]